MGKYNYIDIKNNIKGSGKLIYWLNEKGEIILIDKSKNISKNKIKKMKNITGLLYRLTITFHTGNKPGQGGPLAINIMLFNSLKKAYTPQRGYKDNNDLLKISGNKNGVIWFSLDYLERRGWKDNFINLIYDIVSRKNFEFKIKIYIFDEL
jgi:hypothetical protein